MSAKTVSEQIVDSMTQIDTKALSEIPAMSMGNLCMSIGQALANSAYGTTTAQSQGGVTMQAATVQGVNSLASTGSAVTGRGVAEILRTDKD